MIKTGLDVLVHGQASFPANQRVGLVSMPAAVMPDLTSSIDALSKAGISVTALFGPEHGFGGAAQDGATVGDITDARTGLPIFSLYGQHYEPTPEMLARTDLLVFDMQDVGVLGLAGVGRQEDIERFRVWAIEKFPHIPVRVVNDAEILLAAGSSTDAAIAMVCGTGSIVYGRTARGELIRAGGWGYLFGDEGSGYAIGAATLRAVMQAYDGRGPSTLLTELVLDRRRLSSPSELVHNIYRAESPRLEMASLSDVVEQAAAQGDDVAIHILEEAAQELARTVAIVYAKLDASIPPLIMTGGAILKGKFLEAAFRRACETLRLKFSAIQHVFEPAEGAVQLAKKIVSV